MSRADSHRGSQTRSRSWATGMSSSILSTMSVGSRSADSDGIVAAGGGDAKRPRSATTSQAGSPSGRPGGKQGHGLHFVVNAGTGRLTAPRGLEPTCDFGGAGREADGSGLVQIIDDLTHQPVRGMVMPSKAPAATNGSMIWSIVYWPSPKSRSAGDGLAGQSRLALRPGAKTGRGRGGPGRQPSPHPPGAGWRGRAF